jgi:NAD(P)H-nitrite reductase large subunit
MKTCTECGADKPLCEFHKNPATKDGLRGQCKKCTAVYEKARYESTKERKLTRQKARRAILNRYKRMKGCAVCGERRAPCLEFHAPDGHKDERVSALADSRDRLKAELAACIVVCANCHRLIHAGIIVVGGAK